MEKNSIFLFSIVLIMSFVNIYAQNPFCEILGSPVVGNTLKPTTKIIHGNGQKHSHSTHLEEEGCNFKFLLEDPANWGWSSSNGIQISVDGVDYGIVTLPWGEGGYEEVIRKFPSGKVQFRWMGSFSLARHCFEIYNSFDSLIYKSDITIPDALFLTYQNECIECLPITDLKGEYIPDIKQVNLSWTAPESTELTGFDIFRNDILIVRVPASIVFYFDNTAELEDGDYKYCVIPVYPSECALDEECFETYISNAGIVDYKDNIIVYPNPANNAVHISGADVRSIKIFNNIGQLILTQHNTNTINVSGLPNGIYILSIEISTGYIIHKKIIINH